MKEKLQKKHEMNMFLGILNYLLSIFHTNFILKYNIEIKNWRREGGNLNKAMSLKYNVRFNMLEDYTQISTRYNNQIESYIG